MIWNTNKECMSREQMRELQGKRLQKLVTYVYHNVPFYRSRMQEMDLSPDDIRTIDDIVKLPFTTKQDLRDNYPYGPLLKLCGCMPLLELQEIRRLWVIRVGTFLSGQKLCRVVFLRME